MKKVVVSAIVLLVGVIATAQSGERHRGAMQDLSAEQLASLHTKKLTLALDLNEAQQTKVQAIHLEEATLKKAKMEARAAKKEEGEKTKPTPEERYAMQMERLDHKIAQKAKMKEILSQEQYDKWQRLMAKRGKQKRQKGKKGRKARK